MPLLPVSDLVRQDRQYFIFGVRIEQGVKEDNPFGSSKAGKVGVCMAGPFAGVHLEHAFHSETRLFHEKSNPTFEALRSKRFELVEPRCNDHRIEP